MSKRAAELAAGDKIGSFVVVRNEPYTDSARTWYGAKREVPMVEIIGIRLLFGNCFEDHMHFAADAMVSCEEYRE